MKGLAQFQDDLQIIRRAIYTGQVSAIKLEAQAALMRIRRFGEMLEGLDLEARPEPTICKCGCLRGQYRDGCACGCHDVTL